MAIEIKDVSAVFGERRVLDGVSLTVRRGARIAMLGASGAGKTTLLRIASALLRPTQGTVAVDDVVATWTDSKRRSFGIEKQRWAWPKVCLVFQNLGLFPNLTAKDNILVGIEQSKLGSAITEMSSYAAALGVVHCLERKPRRLSQGEQQRVSIIRALVRHPQYLLLDEPTAALDPLSRHSLSTLLLRWSTERHNAILFATHDWEFATHLAESFYSLRDGHGVCSRSIDDAVEFLSHIKPSDSHDELGQSPQ